MDSPLEKALKILQKRDKTELEMERSLSKHGYNEVQIAQTLEDLIEQGYVDDFRYSRVYIEQSKDKKRGPLRISRELEAKGIDTYTVEDAIFEEIDDEWEYQAANSVAENIIRKNSSMKDEKLLAKVANKLYYEGFHEEIINDVLEDLL